MVSLKHCNDYAVGRNNTPHASGGDTIDVAIEYSPPFYYTFNDTLGGFCHDLMTIMAASHSRPVKFHPIVTLSKALDGLEKGYYDVIIAQFPVTSENKKKYLFTEELYLDRQVLVQRVDKKGNVAITSQLDLAGDTVVVVKGSPMEERVISLSREIGDTIHFICDSLYGPEQLIIKVSTGEIKMAVVNESIAKRMAKKFSNINISTEISFSQFQCMTLKKNNTALCDTLNAWLKEEKSKPGYKTLLSRYFE